MKYLVAPIAYLEKKDFNTNGGLKITETCVIMVQTNYCGYCTSSKPEFQKFAEKHKHIKCLTIQGDEETELIDIITKIKPSFKGYPDYLLFKNGKFINKEIKGRDLLSLEEFVNN